MQFELDSDLGMVAGHVRSLDPLNLTPRLWHPYINLPLHFFSFLFNQLMLLLLSLAEILFCFTRFGSLANTTSCSPPSWDVETRLALCVYGTRSQ